MATTAAAQKTAPAAPVSRLSIVKKGRLRRPQRYLIYGSEGVGKSTLAADAPNPIFFDIEDGTAQLDVCRYPFHDASDGHVPRSYRDVLAALDDLTTNNSEFKTLVFDTADKLESMIWSYMIERDKGSWKNLTSIIGYGYGKGYDLAVDEWRSLCVRLDRLRTVKGMEIVILAHAQIKTFKSPDTDDFDRYQPAMNEKAAGFLKGWADVTGFACYEQGAGKTDGDKHGRAKGFSTGRRLLKLSRTAAFDAKNRINLPDEIEIEESHPWAPFAAAVEAGYETELQKLEAAIAAEVERIGDPALAEKVSAATKDAVSKSDVTSLAHYLTSLKNRPSANTQQ